MFAAGGTVAMPHGRRLVVSLGLAQPAIHSIPEAISGRAVNHPRFKVVGCHEEGT